MGQCRSVKDEDPRPATADDAAPADVVQAAVVPTAVVRAAESTIEQPSADELQIIARHACNYLVVNEAVATGLFDPVRHYHMAPMWDVGSGIAALVAAERLHALKCADVAEIDEFAAHVPFVVPTSKDSLGSNAHADSPNAAKAARYISELQARANIPPTTFPTSADRIAALLSARGHFAVHQAYLIRTRPRMRNEY